MFNSVQSFASDGASSLVSIMLRGDDLGTLAYNYGFLVRSLIAAVDIGAGYVFLYKLFTLESKTSCSPYAVLRLLFFGIYSGSIRLFGVSRRSILTLSISSSNVRSETYWLLPNVFLKFGSFCNEGTYFKLYLDIVFYTGLLDFG